MRCGEPASGRTADNQVADPLIVQFGHRTAATADQELAVVRAVGIRATDEGIERVQTVDQIGLYQKVQCSIHGGWSGIAAILFSAASIS